MFWFLKAEILSCSLKVKIDILNKPLFLYKHFWCVSVTWFWNCRLPWHTQCQNTHLEPPAAENHWGTMRCLIGSSLYYSPPPPRKQFVAVYRNQNVHLSVLLAISFRVMTLNTRKSMAYLAQTLLLVRWCTVTLKISWARLRAIKSFTIKFLPSLCVTILTKCQLVKK